MSITPTYTPTALGNGATCSFRYSNEEEEEEENRVHQTP
jgi:hypothetical protein